MALTWSQYLGIRWHQPKSTQNNIGTVAREKTGQQEYPEKDKMQVVPCDINKEQSPEPADLLHLLPALIKVHTGLSSLLSVLQEWAKATRPSKLICLQHESPPGGRLIRSGLWSLGLSHSAWQACGPCLPILSMERRALLTSVLTQLFISLPSPVRHLEKCYIPECPPENLEIPGPCKSQELGIHLAPWCGK